MPPLAGPRLTMMASDGLRLGLDARLLAYNRGGIARYITALGHALAALPAPAPFDDLVAIYHRKDRAHTLATSGWRGLTAWTPPHHRIERYALALELAPRGLDVLHSPDHVPSGAGRARSVVTVHDLSFLLYPATHSADSRRYYAQVAWTVERADRIIAVSEATKRDLVREVGADPARIRVVHEAATFDAAPHTDSPSLEGRGRGVGAPPPPRRAVGRGAGSEAPEPAPFPQPYVLSVQASIEPRKNIPRLIEAFAQARRAHPALRLVVAGGPGADEPAVRAAVARHDLAAAVDFPGVLPETLLRASYRGALVLAYPSLYEGFGLPLLEAMSVGTPVIAARVSSLPEVAGDAALLVDPFDVDALAGALEQVAGDAALRADLAARGYRRVRRFSWERAAQETLAVYREALGE